MGAKLAPGGSSFALTLPRLICSTEPPAMLWISVLALESSRIGVSSRTTKSTRAREVSCGSMRTSVMRPTGMPPKSTVVSIRSCETEPPKRTAGIKVETAADLVTNLKTAGVL